MFRRHLEQVLGVFTGSDAHVGKNSALQLMGLYGEGTKADSNLVWITKTHYPLDSITIGTFRAQKMIKIARNPLDVIISRAHQFATFSHSVTPNEQYDRDCPDFWE